MQKPPKINKSRLLLSGLPKKNRFLVFIENNKNMLYDLIFVLTSCEVQCKVREIYLFLSGILSLVLTLWTSLTDRQTEETLRKIQLVL